LDTRESDFDEGTITTECVVVTRGGQEAVDTEVINERMISFYVNGQELVTVMATPVMQQAHGVGFLANEGIIQSLEDVEDVRLCARGTCVDMWLAYSDYPAPQRRILTSGCGSGVTFDDLTREAPPLSSTRCIPADTLWVLMEQLDRSASLYKRARGVHTSALSDGERLLLVAEDVGRHNTLDKLRGLALLEGVDTRDCALLTTGRISSEMINKAHRMQTPVVCSRTSPTSLSTSLAQVWNIALVGYCRRNSMRVYTHHERILTQSSG